MTDTTRAKKKRGGSGWAFGLAFVVALVWAVLSLPRTLRALPHPIDTAQAYGAILGSSLVIAVIVWLVLQLVLLRRSLSRLSPVSLIYLVLMVSVVDVAIFSALRSGGEQRAAADQSQQGLALKGIRSAYDAAINKARHGGPPIDVRPTAQGDAGLLEGLTKQFLAKVVTDEQSYRAEMTAIGFPEFLNPGRMAADRGLRSTRAKLAQAQALVQKYRTLQETRLVEFRAAIDNSALSESAKHATLESLDAGHAEALARIDHVWDLEAGILSEYDAAILVLARSQGRWVVHGSQISFYEVSDMQAFNSHLSRAKAMGDEQAAIQAAAQKQTDDELARLISQNANGLGGD